MIGPITHRPPYIFPKKPLVGKAQPINPENQVRKYKENETVKGNYIDVKV